MEFIWVKDLGKMRIAAKLDAFWCFCFPPCSVFSGFMILRAPKVESEKLVENKPCAGTCLQETKRFKETVLKLWLHADNNTVSFPLFCTSQLSWLKGIHRQMWLPCLQYLFNESPCLSWTRGGCHRGKLCVLCQSQRTMQEVTKNPFQGTPTTLGFWFYQP